MNYAIAEMIASEMPGLVIKNRHLVFEERSCSPKIESRNLRSGCRQRLPLFLMRL